MYYPPTRCMPAVPCDPVITGLRINKARRDAGMTIENLSRLSGCSKANIHNLETGSIINPNIIVIGAIAFVLGKKIADFTGMDFLP